MESEEKLKTLKVIKRNGGRVEFDGTKIAVAIKKGFDSINNALSDSDGEVKYSEKDVQKVYQSVLKRIDKEYEAEDRIKIEDIQNLIEEELKHNKYDEVYESFSAYRERRSQSRDMFFDDKRKHKFLKTIEDLGLKSSLEDDTKRENANVDGDTAMGTMLQYGSTISKEFAKTYLIKKKYSDAHDEGYFHIHDMDFYAMGTTTCTQIDLNKLFKNGFSTGHGHLREPNDIMSYSALAAIAIQANQNDQHGGQSIPAFDFYMAAGVLKTYKKQLKQTLADMMDFSGFSSYINMETVAKEIDKIDSIDHNLEIFERFMKANEQVERMFTMASIKARAKTNRITYQAMEAFVHNLNTMHSRAGAQVPFSSINLGTDTSPEGRLIIENFLKAIGSGLGRGETPIFPISIFKVHEGVNYNKEDPNYDLFRLACEVSAKRLFPNFSFIDAPFNKAAYKGSFDTEVAYMGCRTRVLANVIDEEKAVTPGRGNISFSTINLPRLGIKHGVVLGEEKADMKGFFAELEDMLVLTKDQLLDRFAHQCSKKPYNFPFLLGQGLWLDAEKLKTNDRIRKVIKNGTLSIGFIGLAECLKALTGKHHAESEEAQKLGLKIIQFMRDKIDEFAKEYNLNFTCLATPAEGLAGRFTAIDKAIYGKIKGITDRDYYTNSFHVPVHYPISIKKKITLEAPYHAMTNAGHISYIELDGDATENVDAFEKVIRLMKEAGIGYGAINHPVDRDPVCGYVGVIKDVCPGCGRKDGEGVSMEKVINYGASC